MKTWIRSADQWLSQYRLYRWPKAVVVWLVTPPAWLKRLAKKYPWTVGVLVAVLIILPGSPVTFGGINIFTWVFSIK